MLTTTVCIRICAILLISLSGCSRPEPIVNTKLVNVGPLETLARDISELVPLETSVADATNAMEQEGYDCYLASDSNGQMELLFCEKIVQLLTIPEPLWHVKRVVFPVDGDVIGKPIVSENHHDGSNPPKIR